MTQPTNAQLAAQITTLLAKWNAREAEFRDWLAGAPDGGPNNDGRYPLTNASGESFLVDCPAKLADEVDGPAALARTAQLLAEQARDETEGFRNSARDDAELATEAKVDAYAARDLAKVYRDDAASHAANLQATRDAVASDRESAQLARDESVAAKDEAVAAKGVTLVARAEAVAARDQAEAFAASINPATLATKSDLSEEIARIVGSSPETLNALDELAEALGNDPNFATTITNQIAQKAALVHTHGIADILGLQTALDGKQPVGNYVTSAGFTWANLGGKPSTFAPSAHRHSWADLDGVPASFTPSAHGHAIGDIAGLQTALDGKQPLGSYAAANHTHNVLPDTVEIDSSALNADRPSGIYRVVYAGSHSETLLNLKGLGSTYAVQLRANYGNQLFFRTATDSTSNWSNWTSVWHSGNLDPLKLGTGNRPLRYLYDSGAMTIKGDSGGWSTGYFFTGGGETFRGGFGALGGGDGLTYYWIGSNYDAGTAFRVYPNGSVIANGRNILAELDAAKVSTMFNNRGNNHGTFTSFDAVGSFGPSFVHSTAPGTGATQFYTLTLGLGAEYGIDGYAAQIAIPRANNAGDAYLSMRFREAGTWQSWQRIKAGYADTAGRANPRRADGAAWDLNWSGQGGQPTWLVGSNDGVNFYVWNPSNFSVSYASLAGTANALSARATVNGLRPVGVGGDSGLSDDPYTFGYQRAGGWTHPYPDLVFNFYTGMVFGAEPSYGGFRFYSNWVGSGSEVELFSIGNGDQNVRVRNALILGGGANLTNGAANALRISNGSGYVDVGPMNTAWCHFQTDRPGFYFNRPVAVEGTVSRYGQGAFLHHADAGMTSGRIFIAASQPSGMVAGDIWLKPI